MEYLKKVENIKEDTLWNIPEQKQGVVAVVGGNSQNFRTSIRVAEFLGAKFPLRDVKVILPDALKNKLPPLDNFTFLDSTDSGSFKGGEEILSATENADYILAIGDLSKNSITTQEISRFFKKTQKPLIITRDAVDILSERADESTLMHENLIIFGSMIQISKLFQSVFYPKMLLLSQPLTMIAESIHKFTLSYPVSIITFHNNHILIAKNGNINIIPLEKTQYSAITIWSGELAAKIAALNLYNPNNFLDATAAAIISAQH